jgi:hypothetical protein
MGEVVTGPPGAVRVSQVHEEFDVSLLTRDGRRVGAEPRQSYRSRGVRHLREDALVHHGVTDDALAHLVPESFELWLDECHDLRALSQQRRQDRRIRRSEMNDTSRATKSTRLGRSPAVR